MKKIILFIALISLTSCSLFQKNSVTSNMEVPEGEIEIQPEFPGGGEKLYEFITTNTLYPKKAKKEGIEGTVYVQFIVEKDGSLSNIKILRGINESCDQEVLNMLKLMPKWIPGEQKGEKARIQLTLSVRFVL